MADTSFASTDALTKQIWSAKLFKQALGDLFFGKFVGKEGSGNIIETKTDLTKDSGDKITMGLLMKLSGDGKKDDEALEGNEEALTYHDFSTTVHLRQNGVKAAGKMSMRRTAFDIKENAKFALGGWMSEVIDNDTVKALSGLANSVGTISANAPSSNRKWYGGQTTAGVVSSVANDSSIANDTDYLFGTNVISVIKRKAQAAEPKIRPVIVDGEKHYVMFISPYQAKALKAEDAWINAQRDGNVRGRKNPIFSGALGMWDGVVIHDYDRIETRYGEGGSTASEYFESGDDCATGVHVARALFCGAQAGVHVYAQNPGWYEKEFDYGRIPGVATDIIYQAAKTKFNGEDFGSIVVDTAYSADA